MEVTSDQVKIGVKLQVDEYTFNKCVARMCGAKIVFTTSLIYKGSKKAIRNDETSFY